MKIYSKFRDYYDSVQMHGQDDTVHFVRNTEELEYSKDFSRVFKDVRDFNLYYLEDKRTGVELIPFVILFCGKVFRGLKLVEQNRFIKRTIVDLGRCFYDPESAIKFYEEQVPEEKSKYRAFWRKSSDKKNISDWLSNQSVNDLEAYAIKHKIAIAYIGDRYLKNPQLSNYDFFRIVEPYSAYQELDMFISGVLSKDPNMMVTISDKDKISEHGFDKWSFRKLPTKYKVE